MNSRDPLCFAYLDALQRRSAGQPAAVRALLQAKYDAALAACEQQDAAATRTDRTDVANAARPGLLAELVRALEGYSLEGRSFDGHVPVQETPVPELKAVRNFRDTWAQLSARQQLNHALAQAPDNAGPFNSHHLVLRALEMMHEIAPDYLKRFLSYTDTLLHLDQAVAKPAATKLANKPASKTARKAASKPVGMRAAKR